MNKNIRLAGVGLLAFWSMSAIADTNAPTLFLPSDTADPWERRNITALEDLVAKLPVLDSVLLELDRNVGELGIENQVELSAFGLPCGFSLEATRSRETEYAIKVSDPCRADEVVRMATSGLEFDIRLSSTGIAEFHLPGIERNAELVARTANGESYPFTLPKLELDHVARLALAWSGGGVPELRADDGGSVIRLGTGERSVQVISRFIDPVKPQIIRVSLLPDTTAEGCEDAGSGRVFRQIGSGEPITFDLSLATAPCPQANSTLELKNVLEDLKLVAN